MYLIDRYSDGIILNGNALAISVDADEACIIQSMQMHHYMFL